MTPEAFAEAFDSILGIEYVWEHDASEVIDGSLPNWEDAVDTYVDLEV
jgi:hypothetical protein